jgi:hypothetical protein
MYYPKIQSEKSDSTDGSMRSFRTLALLEMHLGQGVQDGGATFQYNILVFFVNYYSHKAFFQVQEDLDISDFTLSKAEMAKLDAKLSGMHPECLVLRHSSQDVRSFWTQHGLMKHS